MKTLLVVLALACAGCHITPAPAPVPPDSGDSGTLPAWNMLDPCGSAAERLKALQCTPKAPDSGTWVDACVNARAHGLKFGTACIRDVSNKAGIAGCGVTCQ